MNESIIPMKKQISLLVSAYSDSKKGQFCRKKWADKLATDGKVATAHRIYKRLREPGIDFLKTQFDDMKSRIMIEPAIGMFCGELEPSIMMGIEFDSETHWLEKATVVKRRMIECGEHFSQLNVHLVDLYATRPSGIEYGQILPNSDVSYQKKLWIQLKNVAKDLFDNYSILKEIADKAGVANLTLHHSATSLLVYSVLNGKSKELVAFDRACRKLKEILYRRDMIHDLNEDQDVALTNYGVERLKGYRQSHSYSEAKRFLDAEADAAGR